MTYLPMRAVCGFAARTLCLVLLFAPQTGSAQSSPAHKSWSDFGGGPDNSHYVDASQINKENVSKLEVAWVYPSNDTISYNWNPLIVGDRMYVLARNNSLVALDATSGKEIWVHEALNGIAPRGINYWESKDHKDCRLIFQKNGFLEEIDAQTGKSILTFGMQGVVDLHQGLRRYPTSGPLGRIQSNNPGKIFGNLLLEGSATGEGFLAPPGDLRAFDVVTGNIVWQFHTIPHPGEYGYDTWKKDAWLYAGGANTWGEISVDEKRGIAYFPTGSATYDFYGADRIGADLFADCLLALDARTGKRLWHFQTTHHDLWDYDNTAAPQLITVTHNGKKVDAVAMAGKTGFLYVFDRVTGKPLWPIEEHPVPKSDMPGEQSWPTQPFPTKPPAFAVQKMSVEDIDPYILTPEEREHWKAVLANARNEGLFTPPAMKDTLQMPGNEGGSNWGTTAANPDKGFVYVMNINEPAILRMSAEAPRRRGAAGANPVVSGSAVQGRAIYERFCQGCHGSDLSGNSNYPSLVDITSRVGADTVRSTITGGRGPMPAFSPDIKDADMNSLLTYLTNPGAAGTTGKKEQKALGGPVVASGGAPVGAVVAGAVAASRGKSPYGSMDGPPYPEGVDVPANRYYTGYNVMGNMIKPPYSTLTAYDLSSGTIQWQVPVGDDLRAVQEGIHDTGAIGIRVGMVTTSAGLIFMAGGDRKVRAYDQETGKVLWTAKLPGQSEGIPAMYVSKGRQYLIVNASQASEEEEGDKEERSAQPRGYVAFALPGGAR
jgi:quinoprotein glucose dehydrogenase